MRGRSNFPRLPGSDFPLRGNSSIKSSIDRKLTGIHLILLFCSGNFRRKKVIRYSATVLSEHILDNANGSLLSGPAICRTAVYFVPIMHSFISRNPRRFSSEIPFVFPRRLILRSYIYILSGRGSWLVTKRPGGQSLADLSPTFNI